MKSCFLGSIKESIILNSVSELRRKSWISVSICRVADLTSFKLQIYSIYLHAVTLFQGLDTLRHLKDYTIHFIETNLPSISVWFKLHIVELYNSIGGTSISLEKSIYYLQKKDTDSIYRGPAVPVNLPPAQCPIVRIQAIKDTVLLSKQTLYFNHSLV